ncbi:MAG: hypothetical protein Q8Q31_04185 [Nanoarchaeota archaeon]|nr:hypothetical protein [Nanoarchaeota archaeon]
MRNAKLYQVVKREVVDFSTREFSLYEEVSKKYQFRDSKKRVIGISELQLFFDFYEASNEEVYTLCDLNYSHLKDILLETEGDFDIFQSGGKQFLMGRRERDLMVVE